MQDVNKRKGVNYPIMNLHERVLVVLSCKVYNARNTHMCVCVAPSRKSVN